MNTRTKTRKRIPVWVSAFLFGATRRNGTRKISCGADERRRRGWCSAQRIRNNYDCQWQSFHDSLDRAEPLSAPIGSRCKRLAPAGAVQASNRRTAAALSESQSLPVYRRPEGGSNPSVSCAASSLYTREPFEANESKKMTHIRRLRMCVIYMIFSYLQDL